MWLSYISVLQEGRDVAKHDHRFSLLYTPARTNSGFLKVEDSDAPTGETPYPCPDNSHPVEPRKGPYIFISLLHFIFFMP
jgi:hypothetical protein